VDDAAIEKDAAGVGADVAAEDLDEGGLAGAVLTYEGEYLAATQVKVHAAEGVDAAEVLIDGLHPKEGGLG
jgi:hypothetical protein